MKYGTNAAFLLVLLGTHALASPLEERLVRKQAISFGLEPVDEAGTEAPSARFLAGKALFETTLLSLNANTSCQSCHLDRFGSADGLPNAIGVLGEGEGGERLKSGGAIVPRNTLPLWGRGHESFDTFFWDGKVERRARGVASQFGSFAPSGDPLVVAVHLPVLQIREMLLDRKDDGEDLRAESVEAASAVLEDVVEKICGSAEISAVVTAATGQDCAEGGFLPMAQLLAAFIREKFRLRPTAFHKFVFSDGTLSSAELAGAVLFYGKGKCAVCHNGPLFSDLDFYNIAFVQRGFGMNGFGVDYGRYNVTHNPADLFKFRTPPLINVEHTAPYSHSGSIDTLEGAIIAHFDPLRYVVPADMEPPERADLYQRLRGRDEQLFMIPTLTEQEVRELVAFLTTLSIIPTDKYNEH